MKTVLFYHAYLDDDANWTYILNEQMSCAKNSGLFDAIDEMYVTCVSNDYNKTKVFCTLINSYFKKTFIEEVKSPFANDMEMINNLNDDSFNSNSNKHTENYTLIKIYNMCLTTDMKVLYLHTKGATWHLHLMKDVNLVSSYKRTYLWRQFMNWVVLENWKKMYQALEKYDLAGINYYLCSRGANTWWATSDHIKRLPDPSNLKWWRDLQTNLPKGANPWIRTSQDRFRIEHWINSIPNIKSYRLIDVDFHPGAVEIPRSFYINKEQNVI